MPPPTFRWRDVMSAGMATSRAEWPRRGPSVPVLPLSHRNEGLRISCFRLLGDGFDTVAVGVSQYLLTRGGAISIAEWDRASHKNLYRASASDLATAKSTFWRPTAFSHWASTCRRLAWHNKYRPSKEKRTKNYDEWKEKKEKRGWTSTLIKGNISWKILFTTSVTALLFFLVFRQLLANQILNEKVFIFYTVEPVKCLTFWLQPPA